MVLFHILDLACWNGFVVSVFRRNFEVSLSVGISEVRSVQSVNLAGLPVIARFESETVSAPMLRILDFFIQTIF